MRRQGLDPAASSLKVGIFGAEPWTEAMRREIEAAGSRDAGQRQFRTRHGFEPLGAIAIPHDGPEITTMWRPARPRSQAG